MNISYYYDLFVHKRSQVEMMQDRGYIVSDDERNLISSFKDFIPRHKEALEVVSYKHKNENKPDTHVLFFLDGNSKRVTQLLKDYPNDSHIIIYDNMPIVRANELPAIAVEFIDKRFLTINPSKHILQSSTSLMSPVDTEIFLANTGFTLDKLPGISLRDALVVYYGYNKRNLIKEKRMETVKTFFPSSEYYRVVRDIPIIYETRGQVADDDDLEDEAEEEEDEYEEEENPEEYQKETEDS